MTEYFRHRPGTVGLFFCGSVAEDTADLSSDLDVRVIVAEEHFEQFCAERETAPATWGQLLFNTGAMESHVCVSHFAPLVKVDVFYYRRNDLAPSPWIARGVRILLDAQGAVQNLVERSVGMVFRTEPAAGNRTINDALAGAHEVIRRVERGELAYAQLLLAKVRWHMAVAEAYLHDKPPIGLSHFETRCNDDELLRAVTDSHPLHRGDSILVALKRLLPILRRQMTALQDRFSLDRNPARDEMSLSIMEKWQLQCGS